MGTLLLAILLFIIGMMMRTRKATRFIAGNHTASKEKRQKMAEKGMSRFIGNGLILCAVILFSGWFLSFFIAIVQSFIWILVVIAIVVLVIRVKRYF